MYPVENKKHPRTICPGLESEAKKQEFTDENGPEFLFFFMAVFLAPSTEVDTQIFVEGVNILA